MSRARKGSWVRTLTEVADPAVRLVCFPHSGGSASAFAGWARTVPPEVELMAVQYPGRGDRFGEGLVDDVGEMAAHVAMDLVRLPGRGTVLFGHSLGALVAYETARALREQGREPLLLCVSACLPPGQMENRDIHRAPDDEFWASLCALGGIDPAIAGDEELRDLLLPTLRSDLRAHATYRPRPGPGALSCPVNCYHGLGDPLVEPSGLPGWAAVTSDRFRLRVRPGGHFHVADDVTGLVHDILGRAPA